MATSNWGAAVKHSELAGLAQDDHLQYALWSQGTFAARPPAGRAGRMYAATDEGMTYYDTGLTWIAAATIPPGVAQLGVANTWTARQTFTDPTGFAGWTSADFRATTAWGDGVSSGPGLDVAGANRYITLGAGGNGIMLLRPHVVWSTVDNAAEIRYGRVGGLSSGAWWGGGLDSVSNFRFYDSNGVTKLRMMAAGGVVAQGGFGNSGASGDGSTGTSWLRKDTGDMTWGAATLVLENSTTSPLAAKPT